MKKSLPHHVRLSWVCHTSIRAEFENELNLVKEGMMTIEEMHRYRMVPLQMGSEYQPYRFGATSNTPQSVIEKTKQKYQDQGREAQIFLITNSGYMILMNRYDPPKKVIYDDITIAKPVTVRRLPRLARRLTQLVQIKSSTIWLIRPID